MADHEFHIDVNRFWDAVEQEMHMICDDVSREFIAETACKFVHDESGKLLEWFTVPSETSGKNNLCVRINQSFYEYIIPAIKTEYSVVCH